MRRSWTSVWASAASATILNKSCDNGKKTHEQGVHVSVQMYKINPLRKRSNRTSSELLRGCDGFGDNLVRTRRVYRVASFHLLCQQPPLTTRCVVTTSQPLRFEDNCRAHATNHTLNLHGRNLGSLPRHACRPHPSCSRQSFSQVF